ncbi:MAG TPA: hypothetical protein VFB37_17140 [Steroidobacteraceae bacterium]|nr:hypothetical protein [Steroidobacteraceae bacterium]
MDIIHASAVEPQSQSRGLTHNVVTFPRRTSGAFWLRPVAAQRLRIRELFDSSLDIATVAGLVRLSPERVFEIIRESRQQ